MTYVLWFLVTLRYSQFFSTALIVLPYDLFGEAFPFITKTFISSRLIVSVFSLGEVDHIVRHSVNFLLLWIAMAIAQNVYAPGQANRQMFYWLNNNGIGQLKSDWKHLGSHTV